jgi:hypothetical protein
MLAVTSILFRAFFMRIAGTLASWSGLVLSFLLIAYICVAI